MTHNLSCPGCARQLSIGQAPSEDTLVQCPACRDVFTLSADGRVVRPEHGSQRPASGSDLSNNPRRPNYLEKDISSTDDHQRTSPWDDGEEDWQEFDRKDKPAKSKRTVFYVLAGVLGMIILVVWAVLHFSASGSERLVGSWKGTFHFLWRENVDCTYRFRRDGTMVDEHVRQGMLVGSTGRYRLANGEVTIHWHNGGFERATVRHIAPDTIEYVIQDHSDRTQIGGKATFVRERP